MDRIRSIFATLVALLCLSGVATRVSATEISLSYAPISWAADSGGHERKFNPIGGVIEADFKLGKAFSLAVDAAYHKTKEYGCHTTYSGSSGFGSYYYSTRCYDSDLSHLIATAGPKLRIGISPKTRLDAKMTLGVNKPSNDDSVFFVGAAGVCVVRELSPKLRWRIVGVEAMVTQIAPGKWFAPLRFSSGLTLGL
jgi:hypothetical protein